MLIHLPRRTRTPVVNSLRIRLAGIVVVLGGLLVPPADAHPDASVRQSQVSVAASAEVPVALYDTLAAAGHVSVTVVETSARGTVIAITAAGAAISLVTLASIEPDYNVLSGHPQTLSGKVVATSAGLFIVTGEKVLAFIPEPQVRRHIHHRRLGE